MTERLDVHSIGGELEKRLLDFRDKDEIIIESGGRTIAKIVPVSEPSATRRVPGLFKKLFKSTDGWEDPLESIE